MEAGGASAEVGLLPFARIALQVGRAVLPRYRSRFSKRQFTQPQLLAILCLMRYEDWTFREAEVRLGEHRELRQALGLVSVPDFTTLYRFLQRLTTEPSTGAVGERGPGWGGGGEKGRGEPAWRSMRLVWRKEPSAHSSCGACIITGRNRCPGDSG